MFRVVVTLGVALGVGGVGLFLLGMVAQKEGGAYGFWSYLLMAFAVAVGVGGWWVSHGN